MLNISDQVLVSSKDINSKILTLANEETNKIFTTQMIAVILLNYPFQVVKCSGIVSKK